LIVFYIAELRIAIKFSYDVINRITGIKFEHIVTLNHFLDASNMSYVSAFRKLLPLRLIILVVILVACKKESVTSPSSNNPITSPPTLTPKPIKISTHINGYYEYLPEGYSTDVAGTKYPLLVVFHGGAETGQDSAELNRLLINGPLKFVKNGTFPTSFTVNNKTYKFIIIAPQFSSTEDPYAGEIDQLIEYAKQNYKVDQSRIYLTGLSFGGGVAWNYVGKNANYVRKIASIVPIAAYISELREEFHINPGKAQIIANSNLPVWCTHNSGDYICPLSWAVNAQSLLKTSNPNPLPKLTIFNATIHEGWTQTYDPSFRENGTNIYEWMLQYHR
jgi:predicted peptidase